MWMKVRWSIPGQRLVAVPRLEKMCTLAEAWELVACWNQFRLSCYCRGWSIYWIAVYSGGRCQGRERSGAGSECSADGQFKNHRCYRFKSRGNERVCSGTICGDSWILCKKFPSRRFSCTLCPDYWYTEGKHDKKTSLNDALRENNVSV